VHAIAGASGRISTPATNSCRYWPGARLRLPDACHDVMAGDIVMVPAGAIHRFEPLDGSLSGK